MQQIITTCALLAIVASDASAAEIVRLPVTQDNSIVLVDGEWSQNAGQQGRIRIKGNQHIVAMNFDTSSIAGKRVRKATLVCSQGEQTISGVSISTIATPWDENRSNGLTAGVDGIEDWGYKGSRFPAVTGGNGFTQVHQVDSEFHEGCYHWDVPPDMVHAMAIGVAHGLAIHEHDADYGRNPTICAREQSGKKPFLIVELDDQAEPVPLPPKDLQLSRTDSLQLSRTDSTSARLMLTPPENGFAYEVLIDGKPLGRHNIPLVSNGRAQMIALRDLPSSVRGDDPHEIKVITLNRTGQRSKAAEIRSSIFEPAPIENPLVTIGPMQSSPIAGLGVIPVTDKYDVTGKSVGNLPEDYRTHNAIYDGRFGIPFGSKHTARLSS